MMATLTVPHTRAFSIQQKGNVAVFSLLALDCHSQTEALELELRAFFEEGWNRFIVDFSQVTSLTDGSFAPILSLKENLDKVPEAGLILCGISNDLHEAHAHLNGFVTRETKEEALAALL